MMFLSLRMHSVIFQQQQQQQYQRQHWVVIHHCRVISKIVLADGQMIQLYPVYGHVVKDKLMVRLLVHTTVMN